MATNPEKLSRRDLIDEISGLKAELARQEKKLRKETDKHRKEVERHKEVEKWLLFQLEQLKRMLFGSKRERFEGDKNQLKLEFEECASQEQCGDETPVKEIITYERERSANKHNGRNKIPEHLPVVEYVVEPDRDTSEMKKIGEERTEILEYTPERFFKLVIVRPKYAPTTKPSAEGEPEKTNIAIAELPSRPIEKCLAGNNLLAAVLINKYVDHLPLYRQLQIFKRSDIQIAPSTIDTWIAHLGKLFDPLYRRLADQVKAQNYLQADETTTKVLDKNKKKETHLGYYWAYHAPMAGLVVFDYQKGRGKQAPRNFLQGYEGVLQTDGYNVYKHYYANERVTHLACWAHVRRKFEKALQSDRNRAEHAMIEIQKLYAIERSVKETSAQERKRIRLEKALPIINDLGKWLHGQRQQVLPKSPMGQAIGYVVPLWESLQNYLHDGNLHIDNNLIENSIRPVALGRKNYLFAGSHEGAERSAMFYSFFACCKLNGINPQKWLTYVLQNIADCKANKLHQLLPNNIDPEILAKFRPPWEV